MKVRIEFDTTLLGHEAKIFHNDKETDNIVKLELSLDALKFPKYEYIEGFKDSSTLIAYKNGRKVVTG